MLILCPFTSSLTYWEISLRVYVRPRAYPVFKCPYHISFCPSAPSMGLNGSKGQAGRLAHIAAGQWAQEAGWEVLACSPLKPRLDREWFKPEGSCWPQWPGGIYSIASSRQPPVMCAGAKSHSWMFSSLWHFHWWGKRVYRDDVNTALFPLVLKAY